MVRYFFGFEQKQCKFAVCATFSICASVGATLRRVCGSDTSIRNWVQQQQYGQNGRLSKLISSLVMC